MKTVVKRVLDSTEKEQAEKNLREAVGLIDKLTTKGIIHKNTAARKKSQLTSYVNKL